MVIGHYAAEPAIIKAALNGVHLPSGTPNAAQAAAEDCPHRLAHLQWWPPGPKVNSGN